MEKHKADALREAFLKAGRGLRPALRKLMEPDVISFAGVEMLVDPSDNFTELHLWLHNLPPEAESLGQLVAAVEGQRALVLDVGANCGAYALPLARAAGPGSRVFAFEPNPVMLGRLGANILRNDLGRMIRVEACALGAAEGEAELRLKPGNYGQASIAGDAPASRSGFTVPVRALGSYLDGIEGYDVSVLKIDIEGGEEAVLGPWLDDGTFARPDLVLMETRHAHLWQRDLVSDLIEAGYRQIFEAEGNTLFICD